MDLDLSEIVPSYENDEERQKRHYERPPQRFVIDQFNIGDQLRFVRAKTATQSESGIIVDIGNNFLSLLMLGNYEPDTIHRYDFPGGFHYLDLVKPSRKLDLGGTRNLVWMHVSFHFSDGRHHLGLVTSRRLCFL